MATSEPRPLRCGFCQVGHHGSCPGTLGTHARPFPCACTVPHTAEPEPEPASSTDACGQAMQHLAEVALAFGRVDRITYHPDGVTPESDTDHTVMLGLLAGALADRWYPDLLDRGRVVEFALVHDLVEVYAGDTPTLSITEGARAAKARREAEAFERLNLELGDVFPWLITAIEEYETQLDPEARFVRALDKVLPKLTHVANAGATLHASGITAAQLAESHRTQRADLERYAGDFPELLAAYDDAIAVTQALLGHETVGAP